MTIAVYRPHKLDQDFKQDLQLNYLDISYFDISKTTQTRERSSFQSGSTKWTLEMNHFRQKFNHRGQQIATSSEFNNINKQANLQLHGVYTQ